MKKLKLVMVGNGMAAAEVEFGKHDLMAFAYLGHTGVCFGASRIRSQSGPEAAARGR